MGLPSLLFIALLLLKLTGNIELDWFWVFSPLIVEFVVSTLLFLFVWRKINSKF